MQYVQVRIGNMPVNLICLEDGKVAFVVVAAFKEIIDMDGACFNMDSFSIGGNEFAYNTPYPYKEIPEMLEYLKKQNLISPFKEKE